MKPLAQGRTIATAAGLCLLLLAGCGSGNATAPSPSASALPLAAPSVRWSPAPTGARLVALVTTVRSGLWEAFRRGREGESLESDPDPLLPPRFAGPSVSALRRYLRSRASPDLDLVGSESSLRGAFADAYYDGSEGRAFEASPSVSAAIQRYFDTHPAAANGASRVAIFCCSGGSPAPTATRWDMEIVFWAEGPRMQAAGQIAPGLNDVMFYMTRHSAHLPWQHISVAPTG